ncbi:MAG: DNA polymerase III subunit delta [Proteocatella sp.]
MNLNSYRKSLLENNKFLIFGQEDYFISYATEVLKTKLSSEFASFNFIEIDQKTMTFNDFFINIESVPMMDTHKVVHLKNFQFAQSSANLWTKEENVKLIELVKNLTPDVNLIVSNSAIEVKDSPNGKKNSYPKFLNDLSQVMTTFSFGNLNARELEEYIMEAISEKTQNKLKLEKSIVKYYIDLTGYLFKDNNKNIREINTEIDKIISYIKEKGSILTEDIERMFLRDYDADIFKLIDYIIRNKKREAFNMYSNLLKKGEPAIKIMVTVGSNISTMIKSSYYMELGYTQAMAAEAMSKNPYAIKKGLENLKIIGRKNAIECLEVILEIDYKVKNGLVVESVYGELALSGIFGILEKK